MSSGAPRARLFLGLDPGAGARRALAGALAPALRGRDELRAVGVGELHVTLVFLGGVDPGRVAEVEERSARACAGRAAPRLACGPIVGVPGRAPRLFALDLADEDGSAGALAGALAEVLVAAGLAREERRPYWPHMTVARVRRGHRAAPVTGVDGARLPAALSPRDVVLYRSRLSPAGARYEPLARWPLT